MIKIIKESNVSELRQFMYDKFPKESYDDTKLYDCLNNHKAINVFQMSAGTASGVVERVRPENLSELTACNAFARPGTIDSLSSYVEGKDGNLKYRNEIINSIFGETFGVCLYQEGVMKIVELLSPKKEKTTFYFEDGSTLDAMQNDEINTDAGTKSVKDVSREDKINNLSIVDIKTEKTEKPVYNGNYARGLLKRLGKKDKKQSDIDSWASMVKDLSINSVKLGVPQDEIRMLVEDIQTLANYSFNKSHALAYSMMAAWTLYLNVYFKKFYYPAVIEYAFDHDKETEDTLKNMRNNGFLIHAPSINDSKARTYSSGNDIYIGLHNLKQVGNAAENIVSKSPYISFREFMQKNINDSAVNKRAVSALVSYGCFDELETTITRGQMISAFNYFWENKPTVKKITEEEAKLIKENAEIKSKVLTAYERKVEETLTLWDSVKATAEKNREFAPKDTQDFLKECETKYLGFNFFITPFSNEIREFLNDKIKKGICINGFSELRKYKNISKVVPVYMSDVREYTDKSGNQMCFLTLSDLNGEEVRIPIFASVYNIVRDKISPGVIALMLLYNTEDNYHGGEQIMFGKKQWTEPEKYSRFIISLRSNI